MKTKLTAGEITTAESLPHDEVITVSQDYTQRRLEELRELNKEMMFTSEEELPIIEDFLTTSIHQAEQEILKRVLEMLPK